MHKKINWPRNRLLLKNLQFLPNHYETLGKCSTHGLILLPKYELDRVKIGDFFIIECSDLRAAPGILYLPKKMT